MFDLTLPQAEATWRPRSSCPTTRRRPTARRSARPTAAPGPRRGHSRTRSDRMRRAARSVDKRSARDRTRPSADRGFRRHQFRLGPDPALPRHRAPGRHADAALRGDDDGPPRVVPLAAARPARANRVHRCASRPVRGGLTTRVTPPAAACSKVSHWKWLHCSPKKPEMSMSGGFILKMAN